MNLVVAADSDVNALDAEAALQASGLTRSGSYYLLPEDAKLGKSLETIRQASERQRIFTYKRRQGERDVEDAKRKIRRWQQELIDLGKLRSRTSEVNRHNLIIERMDVIDRNITQALEFIEKREGELSKLPIPDDLVPLIFDLASRLESTEKEYKRLAADSAVRGAIDAVNSGADVKYKLGPSPRFQSELPQIVKRREAMRSSVVQLEVNAGTATVNVTLNGNVTAPMLVDSGASMILLTPEVAGQLDLPPCR